MKYGVITFTDTADEAQDVLDTLAAKFGDTAIIETKAAGVPAPKAPTPPPAPGVAPPVTATTAVSSLAAGGTPAPVDRDSKGLPHDERIHASTKTKNADGQWKKRKGVDDATINAVEAELRAAPAGETMSQKIDRVQATVAAKSAPVAPPAPTPPAPPAAPAAPVVAVFPPDGWVIHPTAPGYYYKGQEVLTEADLRAKSAPPAAPAVPTAPVAPSRDFAGLMTQISALFKANKIEPTYPNTVVARINDGFKLVAPNLVSTLPDIANNADYVDYAWSCLDVDGKAA